MLGGMVNGVFSQPLRHIRITNTSNKLFTSKNIPDLHFRVDSKHHVKYGRGIPQLMSCLLQPFFQVFIYKLVCFLQDRLAGFYIYRTCSNFYEHFRILHDWLRNILQLFSAYLNKETREKLLCLEILFGCIFDSPGYK